jgi:hypothetical protein
MTFIRISLGIHMMDWSSKPEFTESFIIFHACPESDWLFQLSSMVQGVLQVATILDKCAPSSFLNDSLW